MDRHRIRLHTVDRQLECLQLADIDGDGALDLLSSAGPQVPIRGVGLTFLGWPTGALGSLDWHPEDGQETRMAIYPNANEDGFLDLVTMDMVGGRYILDLLFSLSPRMMLFVRPN